MSRGMKRRRDDDDARGAKRVRREYLKAVRITGFGSELPGAPIDNDWVVECCNLPDKVTPEWIDRKIGITTRHVARKYPTKGVDPPPADKHAFAKQGICDEYRNSSLSARAIEKALAMAGLTVADLDLIVHTSCTPDYPIPPTSTYVQEKLGIKECATMDIRSACCGSSQGLNCAWNFLKAGTYRTAVVVGCEVGSVFGLLDQDDPAFQFEDTVNAVIIGDGAGAMVLQAFEEEETTPGVEIMSLVMNSVGAGESPGIYIPAGGSIHPCNQKTLDSQLHHFKHDFKKVLQHGPELYMRGLNDTLSMHGLSMADIDVIIPHQANGKVKMIARGLGVPEEKIYFNFDKIGNTGNASLPICLDEIMRQGLCPDGGLVLVLAAESTKWLYGAWLLKWHPVPGMPGASELRLAREEAGWLARAKAWGYLTLVNAALGVRSMIMG